MHSGNEEIAYLTLDLDKKEMTYQECGSTGMMVCDFTFQLDSQNMFNFTELLNRENFKGLPDDRFFLNDPEILGEARFEWTFKASLSKEIFDDEFPKLSPLSLPLSDYFKESEKMKEKKLQNERKGIIAEVGEKGGVSYDFRLLHKDWQNWPVEKLYHFISRNYFQEEIYERASIKFGIEDGARLKNNDSCWNPDRNPLGIFKNKF